MICFQDLVQIVRVYGHTFKAVAIFNDRFAVNMGKLKCDLNFFLRGQKQNNE